MQAQAVRLNDGWYIKHLSGFEDIKSDTITLNVELNADQQHYDYQELKGIAIMDRYYEKQQREERRQVDIAEIQAKFRAQFSITSTNFSCALKAL